jgi:SAM-dependent methyltransferase
MAQLPFNTEETVELNTPMIDMMNDSGNVPVARANLKQLGIYSDILKEDKVFAEIGCGSGYLIEELYKEGNGTYIGFEPITSEYNKAVKRLTPYREKALLKKTLPQSENEIIKKCLLEESGYPENSLDYIYSYHVFEHLENPLVMLEAALKWLKPGGKLIITCPNVEGYMPRKNLKAWRCSLPSHRWLPGKKTLKRAVRSKGLSVRACFTYGGYPAPRNLIKSLFNKYLKVSGQGDVVCLMAEK